MSPPPLAAVEFEPLVERVRQGGEGCAEAIAHFAATHGGEPFGAALASLAKATDHFLRGRYPEGAADAQAAVMGLAAVHAPQQCGDAELILGSIALERGDYDDAAAHYTAAAQRWEGLEDRARLGRVHNNLGLVAWRTQDLERAAQHYQRALELFGPAAPAAIRANILSNLGLVREDQGDARAAREAYDAAITLAEEAGDRNILANALSNLGDHLEAAGDRALATRLHQRALGLREEVGHARGIVGSRIALGRLALAAGQIDAATAQAQSALQQSRHIGLRKHEADAQALLAQVFEAAGAWKEALAAERAATRLRIEVQSHQVADRVAALQARFDAQQTRLLAQRAAAENERLQDAMVQVEAASRARGRFLAVMSHEMRTPLSSILGAAQLLDLQPLDDGQRRLVQVVSASASALLATINDVLDFSRIDAGQIEIVDDPFDPAALIGQVMDIVETPRRAKGIGLHFDCQTPLPARLQGDGPRVRQVLLNLVANAVKFTEAGGVTIRAAHDHTGLTIEVIDTGPGVPLAAQARIFEPFFQADAGAARRHGGSGLGLSIVQHIVAAMGGDLWFHSVPNEGTTFRLHLPLRALEPAPAPPVRRPPRILLADDDALIREVMLDILDVLGAEVVAVPSGPAAIGAMQRGAFDLILLDLHMPGQDGWATARALQALPQCPPIVALSGAIDAREASTLREAGFHDAVAKPVSMARLELLLAAVPLP